MAFQYTYPEDRERQDAQALRYWAGNAPDMHEPSTYQQEPSTLGQQAIEDQRTESAVKKAAEAPGGTALPKPEKSKMFGLDFKGMTGAPPPPDQPNRGLPLNTNPQTDYKPSRTADWKKWQQKMMQFSGAKTPEEVTAVNEQIGTYKQRRFAETWNQAMALHQQGNVEGAAQLYQRAYDYFTNGQGATMRGDPQTGKVLAMPYHEDSGVAGKAQAFGVEDAKAVLSQFGPGAFGRDPAGTAQASWGQEQRAQQMQPSALALQEAKVQTEGARPGYLAAQTGYTNAQADRSRRLTPLEEEGKGLENTAARMKIDMAEITKGARETLQNEVTDFLSEGPLFQERLAAFFPDGGATSEEVRQMRDTLIDGAVDEFAYTAMPEELVRGKMLAQAAALKAQAKAMSSQEITPDYRRKIKASVDEAFSPARMEEGKGSSDLLEKSFWSQSGAGLDQVKSYAQRLIHAETQAQPPRFITGVDAVNAMKSFYTNEDNTVLSPDKSFYVTKIPETGQLIEMPADIVVPMQRLAAEATVKAKQRLENQQQTELSREQQRQQPNYSPEPADSYTLAP